MKKNKKKINVFFNNLIGATFETKILRISIFCLFFILITFFISIAIYSVNSDNKKSNACELIPENISSIIYIKDFPKLKKSFLNSDFAKKFKDNYIYLDFKYKYYQNVDLFFVKLNFNIEKFFNIIKNDFVLGELNNNYFVISTLDLKTKIIYSIFNLIPETKIVEIDLKNLKVYNFKKGEYNIYYTSINDFFVISTDLNVIVSILNINNSKEKSSWAKLSTTVNANEIFYHKKLDYSEANYNKYSLLPNFYNVSLKLNIETIKLELNSISSPEFKPNDVAFTKNDFEFLKLLSTDFSMVYYNNDYNVSNVLYNIIAYKNENGIREYSSLNEDLEEFKNFKTGAYFLYNGLGSKYSDNLNPQIGIALRLKDDVSKSSKEKIMKSYQKIIESVFGISYWGLNEYDEYSTISSEQHEFKIIITKNFFIFCNGSELANNIINNIGVQQITFYDKFYENLNMLDLNTLNCFCCINLDTSVNSIEPIFQEYANSKLYISGKEYDRSFGQLFQYLKSQRPVIVSLYYKKNIGYYGYLDYVKATNGK